MKETLYITSNNTELQKDHDSIICKYPDPDNPGEQLKKNIPVHRLSSIEMYGNVSITMPVLQLCSELGIPCFFNTYNGNPIGMFVPVSGSNPITRLNQYAGINDKERRLLIAKTIVYKAIQERISVVKKHGKGEYLQDVLHNLEQQQSALLGSHDINEVRGHEGTAMRVFFDVFGRLLNNLPFHNRSRNPPEVREMLC